MTKIILSKIVVIFMILVLSNWIYTRWFFEADLQEHAEIINLVLAIPADSDILYLGESSNNTFRGDDMDKRPISAFLGDFYPDLKINDITQHAAHAGIYKVLLNHIPTTNKARTIVVTLNLRSFNAQWIYSDLETALQKSLVLLKPYPPLFNRFLLSFKAYDIKTEKERQEQYRRKWRQDIFRLPFDFPFKNVSEWDAYIWKNGFTNPDGTPNDELKELVCHYIKAYAFQIDTLTNPRIKDFDEIVALAQDRNWNIVFNLLAENTEKAQEIVGDELIFMMNENAKLLEEYYSKKGVVVVNNLNAVGDDEFIDQHWTTEHYAENGRKTIARELAESLKIWHGNLYHEVALETKFKTSFFNDCDNNIPWGQTHTISTEKAFSGSKSSRIGAGEAYSITMEYPLKKIPDSLKHSLHVELLFYQKATVSEALLVVEALGDDFENYWVGFPLNDSVSEVNNWAKFEKSLVIPEHIKSANVIKVYVYNPSKHILYVDDFRITLNPF